MKPKITVIGSSNTDMVVKTTDFPRPGETVTGGDFFMFSGGKGANQAVAASRMGGDITFVAKIGNDIFGKNVLQGLEQEGVNTKYIIQDNKIPSGVAIITVNDEGENSIVVAPGSNSNLTANEICNFQDVFEHKGFVLIQLEIPIEVVKYTIELATEKGCKVILNPAPAKQLNDEYYDKLYLITPNEIEASILSEIQVTDIQSAKKAAEVLLNKGIKNVIITLGSKGAYFYNHEESFLVSASKVIPIDTTAAGDIFNGALTVALAENQDWRSAISIANKASAISISRMGAQTSAPFRSEVIRTQNILSPK